MHKTVIFFPGFRKHGDDFNTTDKGVSINIEKVTQKRANTYLVNLSEADYLKSHEEICNSIMLDLQSTNTSTSHIVLVGHSHGAFYCFKFAELYAEKIKGMLVIDCPIKNEHYKTLLQSKDDAISRHKVDNFATLSDGLNINKNIPITIMMNNKKTANDVERLAHFKNIAEYSKKGEVMEFDRYGHMIHYFRSDVVIKIINQFFYYTFF